MFMCKIMQLETNSSLLSHPITSGFLDPKIKKVFVNYFVFSLTFTPKLLFKTFENLDIAMLNIR